MSKISHQRSEIAHPAPHRHRVPGWQVMAGLAIAPLAWFVQLNASYLLGTSRCPGAPPGLPPALAYALIVTAGVTAAILALLALWAAARAWTLTRDEGPGDQDEALTSGHGRTRFLALAGFISSSIFLIAIIFLLMIPLLENTCQG